MKITEDQTIEETADPTFQTYTLAGYEGSGKRLFEISGNAIHKPEDINALWRGNGIALNSCTLEPIGQSRFPALLLKIERSETTLDLSEEVYEPVEFNVERIKKCRYTDGMKYITTLGLVGAILKATSEYHHYDQIAIGINRKRALTALESSDVSADVLSIPYTHSWESLCESVIHQILGRPNELTAEIIRQLTGFQEDPITKIKPIKKVMPQASLLVKHL